MGEEGEGWRRGIGLWLGKGIWLVGLKVVGAESQPAISRKRGNLLFGINLFFFFLGASHFINLFNRFNYLDLWRNAYYSRCKLVFFQFP